VERTVAYNTGGVADCGRTKILNNVLGPASHKIVLFKITPSTFIFVVGGPSCRQSQCRN
jgi:hypothetical protein